jgi:hypothetical protein
MRKFLLAILFLFTSILLKAQDTIASSGDYVLYGIVVDGDTLLVSSIEEIYILPMPKFTSRRQERRYNRLVKKVKKVYPYAKLAKEKYELLEAKFLTMKTERERKAYIKQVEQELKDEFEGELKNLTISEGAILIKLIDREIGETSYELLKEFRGDISAFFWQTLARVFGHNLKNTFDAEGEDKLINDIVMRIENGQL